MCLSQRQLLGSEGPLVEELQLLLPVVLAGNKYEYSAPPVWWEGRDWASFSIFALCVWIRGTEQVPGGTQAKETTEHVCLGISTLGMTSCYKLAFAAHWELFAVGKQVTHRLVSAFAGRELQFKENSPASRVRLRHSL